MKYKDIAKRNEEMIFLFKTTDVAKCELAERFTLGEAQVHQVLKGTVKDDNLMPYPYRTREVLKHKHKICDVNGKDVGKSSGFYPIPESDYVNLRPHPRVQTDYGLAPLNPAFGKLYLEGEI